ncbi:MAG TPA: imidazole glycerol phosphate synthase subunit HisH [Actinomycetaceae bacterium]|nr:imidazole glycerol phosphate synthase subunit HisH [Actinomycetaceae bacterium]
MTSRVVVLDYGSGNVRSAARALQRAGAAVELTADPKAILAADGLVVPGVGAFATVMRGLSAVRAPYLIDRRLSGGRPVLGICVGLQVMFEEGTEHGTTTAGLGQWPGAVVRLEAPIVPHMGWSEIRVPHGSELLAGLEGERFYFVHSYGVTSDPSAGMVGPTAPPLVTWATHGTDFVAAVENGSLTATQFHPEKSGDAGAQMLTNWLATL